jgi:hypothetical protein
LAKKIAPAATRPIRETGRVSTVSSDLGRTRPPGPSRGTAVSWAATAITAKTAATANAARHVVSVPISDAAGKLATVAMKIPELTTAIAVPRACSLTRLIAAPAPNTQNPPTPIPSTARAASITPMPGARPAITSETRTSALRPTSTLRRSSRAEHSVSSGAATAAVTAGTTTISPPVPTETRRCPLMSPSSPTGTTSENTSANDPSAIETTAAQALRSPTRARAPMRQASCAGTTR